MKNKMKIQNWLYFNRKERTSLIVFIIFMSAVNLCGIWLKDSSQKEIIVLQQSAPDISESAYSRKSSSLRERSSRFSKNTNENFEIPSNQKIPKDFFNEGSREEQVDKDVPEASTLLSQEKLPLDPNTAKLEELVAIGLTKSQSNNVINYREKVKPFLHSKDLLKIYTIDEMDFERIKPFIQINEIPHALNKHTKIDKTVVIDVNAANAEEWQLLKGIGPYYSKKIIGYRNKLGGFVNINQIKETWDIPSETIDSISAFLTFETGVQTIDIRTADFKTLIQHPYIDKRQTKLLLKLQNKPVQITEAIMLDIFSHEDWKKVRPYIKYED